MNEQEEKEAFAIALLKEPNQPFKAAQAVFGSDTSRALELHALWAVDIEVKQYQADYLKLHGAEAVLPTKEAFARTVYNMAVDKKNAVEDRLKALRLYGDIRGFIEKPGTTIDARTQQITNRVMVVNRSGNDDVWAAKLKEQQKKLTSANS